MCACARHFPFKLPGATTLTKTVPEVLLDLADVIIAGRGVAARERTAEAAPPQVVVAAPPAGETAASGAAAPLQGQGSERVG